MSIFRSEASKHIPTVFTYWHELAQCIGLRHTPESSTVFPGQRLIGKIGGYLVMVCSGFLEEIVYPVLFVIVRYTPVDNETAFQSAIKNDLELTNLLGRPRSGDRLFLYNETRVAFAYRPQKETVEQLANRIVELLKIIAMYTHPFPLNLCEGPHCRWRNVTLQVVMINQWPMLLCPDCTNEVPTWGLHMQKEHEAAPTRLLRGALVGLGAALIGALAWAAIAVLFNYAAAVASAVTFIGIVKVMDCVRTKRTLFSMLTAGILAVLSVVLGAYLALVWTATREVTGGNLGVILSLAWQSLRTSQLLGLSIFVCLVGVVPYLFYLWKEQREYYSQMFHPEVEVVGAKWF